MWNTKPMLISKLILVHLTVHTIASSLQVDPSVFFIIFSLLAFLFFFPVGCRRRSSLHNI